MISLLRELYFKIISSCLLSERDVDFEIWWVFDASHTAYVLHRFCMTIPVVKSCFISWYRLPDINVKYINLTESSLLFT